MARGRFISNSISTSKKFSRLECNDHRLMYLMLVPHVDADGRHDADPRILNGQVYTLLGLDIERVEAGLNDMREVGLIHLYEVDGDPFLEIVGFLEHNTPHHREKKDLLPPPDQGTPLTTPKPNVEPSKAEASPKQQPSKAEACQPFPSEEKRREVEVEEKGREHTSISKPPAKPPQTLAAPPPRESHDPGLFKEIWNTNRGRLPAVHALNNKRKGQIRALVKEHGAQPALELFRDATRAVANDEFWINRQYGFDNLLANKVLQKAEQWRAGAVQLGAGNLGIAQNVERWSKALPPDDGVN